MSILGDLNKDRPNPDLAKARLDQEPVSVGDVPLNNASERVGIPAQSGQSGRSGGVGRSSERKTAAESQPSSYQRGGDGRSLGGLWLAVTVLALALIGVMAYAYLAARQNNVSISQLPGAPRLAAALAGRMDSTEAKLRDLAANWGSLAERVTLLDHKVSASLAATRSQTRERISQAEVRLRAEMDKRIQASDARLARVESAQAEDRARLAQVQDQLQKQERLPTEIASLRQQVAGNQNESGQDLANLHEQVSQSQSELHALTQQQNRPRVYFELAKHTEVELVPGVSLTVLRTDVSYQRFAGYLSLTDEGRTLWLPNAGAQEAVNFYSKRSSRPYDLVATAVSKHGIVGYLLLPAGGSPGEPEAARIRPRISDQAALRR